MPILENLQNLSKDCRLPFQKWIFPSTSKEKANVPPPLYAWKSGFSFSLKSISSNLNLYVNSKASPEGRDLIDKIESSTTLDRGQCVALVGALVSEYALIQGPPGTGKLYLGVNLMWVLLDSATKVALGPIIVVCHTNHALDQFLEHLIKVGIEKVIRIGGRSNSLQLADKNLKEMFSQRLSLKGLFSSRADKSSRRRLGHFRRISWLWRTSECVQSIKTSIYTSQLTIRRFTHSLMFVKVPMAFKELVVMPLVAGCSLWAWNETTLSSRKERLKMILRVLYRQLQRTSTAFHFETENFSGIIGSPSSKHYSSIVSTSEARLAKPICRKHATFSMKSRAEHLQTQMSSESLQPGWRRISPYSSISRVRLSFARKLVKSWSHTCKSPPMDEISLFSCSFSIYKKQANLHILITRFRLFFQAWITWLPLVTMNNYAQVSKTLPCPRKAMKGKLCYRSCWYGTSLIL